MAFEMNGLRQSGAYIAGVLDCKENQ